MHRKKRPTDQAHTKHRTKNGPAQPKSASPPGITGLRLDPGAEPQSAQTAQSKASPSVPVGVGGILDRVLARFQDIANLIEVLDTVFGDKDVIKAILVIQRPGPLSRWWEETVKPHRNQWTHPLSKWERGYFHAVKQSIFGTRGAVDPQNPTMKDVSAAKRLFGSGQQAMEMYANYENRRRIVKHYFDSHPETARMRLAGYRLARDLNPLHFALERGWQMGSGQEMFTRQEVSRVGAAAEFAVALVAEIAMTKAKMAGRSAPKSHLAGTFNAEEQAIIQEVRSMLKSAEIAKIRNAHALSQDVTIRIGSRTLQYEPNLAASGMTMFGENGFLIGRQAFQSESEFVKTLLHETHRLETSAIGRGGGASGASVAAETQAAFDFAERAFPIVMLGL